MKAPVLEKFSILQFAPLTAPRPTPPTPAMRVCYVLRLLFSQAPTLSLQRRRPPSLAAADAVQPVDQATTDNRFLRSYHDLDEEDDDNEEEEAADEERGRPLFDTKKLNKALNNYEYSEKLFARWKNNDYTDVHAAAKIGVDVNGGFDQTFSSLYTAYRAYLRNN